MNRQEEIKLVKHYQETKSKSALGKILAAHDNFFWQLARQYWYLGEAEDIKQQAALYFIEQLKFIKIEKSKLSTYCYHNVASKVRCYFLAAKMACGPGLNTIGLCSELFYFINRMYSDKSITDKDIDGFIDRLPTKVSKSVLRAVRSIIGGQVDPDALLDFPTGQSTEDLVYLCELLDIATEEEERDLVNSDTFIGFRINNGVKSMREKCEGMK